jgi:hypothetical protein
MTSPKSCGNTINKCNMLGEAAWSIPTDILKTFRLWNPRKVSPGDTENQERMRAVLRGIGCICWAFTNLCGTPPCWHTWVYILARGKVLQGPGGSGFRTASFHGGLFPAASPEAYAEENRKLEISTYEFREKMIWPADKGEGEETLATHEGLAGAWDQIGAKRDSGAFEMET